ncbi:uncharacterized protein LOC136026255 [Artemia franciscana]|uniref:uncharacterized protein LOC136026255 n=1 Tax=Artemia franciscana TaxID=6661 RepID=UPI0032DBCEF7
MRTVLIFVLCSAGFTSAVYKGDSIFVNEDDEQFRHLEQLQKDKAQIARVVFQAARQLLLSLSNSTSTDNSTEISTTKIVNIPPKAFDEILLFRSQFLRKRNQNDYKHNFRQEKAIPNDTDFVTSELSDDADNVSDISNDQKSMIDEKARKKRQIVNSDNIAMENKDMKQFHLAQKKLKKMDETLEVNRDTSARRRTAKPYNYFTEKPTLVFRPSQQILINDIQIPHKNNSKNINSTVVKKSKESDNSFEYDDIQNIRSDPYYYDETTEYTGSYEEFDRSNSIKMGLDKSNDFNDLQNEKINKYSYRQVLKNLNNATEPAIPVTTEYLREKEDIEQQLKSATDVREYQHSVEDLSSEKNAIETEYPVEQEKKVGYFQANLILPTTDKTTISSSQIQSMLAKAHSTTEGDPKADTFERHLADFKLNDKIFELPTRTDNSKLQLIPSLQEKLALSHNENKAIEYPQHPLQENTDISLAQKLQPSFSPIDNSHPTNNSRPIDSKRFEAMENLIAQIAKTQSQILNLELKTPEIKTKAEVYNSILSSSNSFGGYNPITQGLALLDSYKPQFNQFEAGQNLIDPSVYVYGASTGFNVGQNLASSPINRISIQGQPSTYSFYQPQVHTSSFTNGFTQSNGGFQADASIYSNSYANAISRTLNIEGVDKGSGAADSNAGSSDIKEIRQCSSSFNLDSGALPLIGTAALTIPKVKEDPFVYTTESNELPLRYAHKDEDEIQLEAIGTRGSEIENKHKYKLHRKGYYRRTL